MLPEPRFASPAAAELAAELCIDPVTVPGTGRGGGITVADLRAARPAEAPEALGPAGSALWRAILSDVSEDWELDRRELHLLERACICADRLAELDAAVARDGATTKGSRGQIVAHPALAQATALEIVQLRLLSALELADPAEARSPTSQRNRRAADVRWSRRDRIEQQRRVARERGQSHHG
ncbi:MAG: P27 family phage terminase small subunit [Solirubrobacterales bacterium]